MKKLHGLLEVHFRGRRGHYKVMRNEYCLMSSDSRAAQPIATDSDLVRARRPGSKLLMFMKVEPMIQYSDSSDLSMDGDVSSQICPQCGFLNYYNSTLESIHTRSLNW